MSIVTTWVCAMSVAVQTFKMYYKEVSTIASMQSFRLTPHMTGCYKIGNFPPR